MKASALSGDKHSVTAEYMIRLLALEECADVGNQKLGNIMLAFALQCSYVPTHVSHCPLVEVTDVGALNEPIRCISQPVEVDLINCR